MLAPTYSGILITTDIPTKHLILFLDKENNRNIVIKDLDDHHLLINPAYRDFVREEVERLYNQNTYERKDIFSEKNDGKKSK